MRDTVETISAPLVIFLSFGGAVLGFMSKAAHKTPRIQ